MTKSESRFSSGPVAARLKDKVVLITGAGSGQGQAAALLFAQAGATVSACDINAHAIESTATLAKEQHLTINIATVDACDPTATSRWVNEAVNQHGGVDVLYNNAAGAHAAPFAEMTLQQWQETLRWELDIVFVPTKSVWPHLIARGGGSIINIASGCGMRGTEFIGAAAHAAGKAGVIGVTRQLALEGAPHWIRVNSISPGGVLTTPIQAMYDKDPEVRRHFDGWPLLARVARAVDIAYAGLFFASDESAFITGVNLPVDGGWTSKGGLTSHESAAGFSGSIVPQR